MDPRACRDIQPDLSAWLDGELEPLRRSRVEDHLRRCPSCRHLLRELRSAARALARLPRYDAPSELSARLEQQLAPGRRLRSAHVWAFQRGMPLSAAAAILALICLAVWRWEPRMPASPRQPDRAAHRPAAVLERATGDEANGGAAPPSLAEDVLAQAEAEAATSGAAPISPAAAPTVALRSDVPSDAPAAESSAPVARDEAGPHVHALVNASEGPGSVMPGALEPAPVDPSPAPRIDVVVRLRDRAEYQRVLAFLRTWQDPAGESDGSSPPARDAGSDAAPGTPEPSVMEFDPAQLHALARGLETQVPGQVSIHVQGRPSDLRSLSALLSGQPGRVLRGSTSPQEPVSGFRLGAPLPDVSGPGDRPVLPSKPQPAQPPGKTRPLAQPRERTASRSRDGLAAQQPGQADARKQAPAPHSLTRPAGQVGRPVAEGGDPALSPQPVGRIAGVVRQRLRERSATFPPGPAIVAPRLRVVVVPPASEGVSPADEPP